jgi:tetratricopeptide (TPR) repeat protein
LRENGDFPIGKQKIVECELWKRHPDESAYWINLAWFVRRSASIEAEQVILQEPQERFPNDALITYNLGSFSCQLGDMERAKKYVGDAIKLDSKNTS